MIVSNVIEREGQGSPQDSLNTPARVRCGLLLHTTFYGGPGDPNGWVIMEQNGGSGIGRSSGCWDRRVMSAPPTTAVVETALMTMRPPVALNPLAKYTATSLLAGHGGVP